MKPLDTKPLRHDRLLKEHNHDPYQLRHKLKGSASCPACGALYQKGRWRTNPKKESSEMLCPACRRGEDKVPAGELKLFGGFVAAHKTELLNLINNVASREAKQHPMNRLLSVVDKGGEIYVSTADIHLPQEISHALTDAFGGTARTNYVKETQFVRVNWTRKEKIS